MGPNHASVPVASQGVASHDRGERWGERAANSEVERHAGIIQPLPMRARLLTGTTRMKGAILSRLAPAIAAGVSECKRLLMPGRGVEPRPTKPPSWRVASAVEPEDTPRDSSPGASATKGKRDEV